MKSWINQIFVALYKLEWVKKQWATSFKTDVTEGNPFAPAPASLSQIKLALISTGGSHHREDQPFDMENVDGDGTCRSFPHDLSPEELTITHNYYDHRSADQDINCVVPLQPLKNAVQAGKIGSAASEVYSLMGHIQNQPLEHLKRVTIPNMIQRLKQEGVTACLVSPA